MRKVISLFLSMAIAISVVPATAFAAGEETTPATSVWDGTTVDKDWEGLGTEASPYLITSSAQLAGLANKTFYADSTSTDVPVKVSEEANVYNSYTGVYFKLMSDIDLNGEEWLPIGRHGMRFNGVFDGNNHVIKNLKITTNYFGVGLFGATGSSAVIKNLGIDTADIAISSKGANNAGTFDSVYAKGLANPDKTWTTEALFKTDRSNGAGTLVGLFSGGTISDCYVKNTQIKNTNASSMFMGGFLGSAMGTVTTGTRATITVTNSYANGVNLSGAAWNPAAFIGNLNYRANATTYPRWVNLTAINCYVADYEITDGSPICAFTAVNNNGSVAVNTVKCYTDSASFKDGYKTDGGVVTADKATITATFTALNGWSTDSADSPVNNGYPVLAWEDTWTPKPTTAPTVQPTQTSAPTATPTMAPTATPVPTPVPTLTPDFDWSGDGTNEAPYLITSAEELAGLATTLFNASSETASTAKMPVKKAVNAENPDNNGKINTALNMYFAYTGKHFKLTTDIDLKNREWTPIGRYLMRFDGIFNGDGHVIRNVRMRNEYSAMGLFGATGSGARIANLGVDGVDISTVVASGNVADYVADGDVTNGIRSVYALGGLVGAMWPGGTAAEPMLNGCFVKNAKIGVTNSTAHYGMGGLFGSVDLYNPDWSSSIQNFYAKNCYVLNVDLTSSARCGALFGTNYGYFQLSGYDAAIMNLTNCYAGGNIKLTSKTGSSGILYNIGYLYGRANSTYIDIYSTTESYTKLDAGLKGDGEQFTDGDGIVSTFVLLDGWSADIRGGMPMLEWEAKWLVGDDTDLVSTKLMNMLTGGQSPFHIFRDMNFMETAQIDGVDYNLYYTSKYTDIITNAGAVKHTDAIRKNDVSIFLQDINGIYKKETVNFTVMPRGIEIIVDGFDGDLTDWTVSGDISQSESQSGYLLDKMVNVGEGGAMVRTFTNYTDSKLNAILSVCNDIDFETVTLLFGEAEVIVTKSDVTVNGETHSIVPPEGWFDINICADIDTDEITVTIGDNSITSGFDFRTVDSITIKDGNAKVDNLLVYEFLPNELDKLTEELVLNGQSKYEVKSALNLPDKVNYHRGEVDILWESSNEDVVKLDGTLGVVELTTKVILTAKAYYKNGDEVPTEDEILQTKKFEVHVVPVGSRLIFSEDFEAATTEGQPIEGFGEWTVGASEKWVRYSVERDPDSSPIDGFGKTNKVMLQDQLVNGHETSDNPKPSRRFDGSGIDVYEISHDIYTTLSNHQLFLEILNSNGGVMTTARIMYDNGWLSETVEGGKKRIRYEFKPGNWQNYKYVVNTIEKTIAVYVDGAHKQTLRYNTSADVVGGIRIGTQRQINPAGEVYYDNIMVRSIMPEDSLAVLTVKNNLSVDEMPETNMELPVTGNYGTDIIWETSDADVIDINGTVTRQSSEKTVTLKATVVKGETTATREFTVTVPATEGSATPAQELLDSIAENFLWSEVSNESQFAITQDIDLSETYNKGVAKELGGVSISWTTTNENVIDADGNVTRTGSDAMTILTATFTKGTVSAKKSFKAYVLQTGAKETVTEDFESYDAGKDIEDESALWTDTAQKSVGNARVLYDDADISNKMLNIRRKTSTGSHDMKYRYDVCVESSDMLVSMMFKLRNTYDVIKFDIGGTNHRVIITPTSVKIGEAVLEKTLNLDEWYQITLYYNATNGTFDAYLDTEKFTPVPFKYEGDAKVDGITINNLSADRSGISWCVDEITVRDISISDDTAAIKAALKEVELKTTTIEWNIEDLPAAARYGVAIEWVSERPDVLTNDGIVTRKVGESYNFKFTARASRNGVTIDKDFNVTVPEIPAGFIPEQEIFEKHMSEIPFSRFTDQNANEITNDIDLITFYSEGNASFYGGATVEWSSNKPNVIDSKGKVTRPYLDESVTLTAVYKLRIDPTIQTTVTYKVIVWGEGTVIFREDFESVPAEHEGAAAEDVDSRFHQEVQAQIQAQFVRFRKDLGDTALPWSEANKVVAVERERGYDPSPERIFFYFPEGISDLDSVAISFDYMIEEKSVVGTVGFEELIFQPRITNSSFNNRTMLNGAIQPKKWYTFTYIMMKSAGLIMVLRDGDRAVGKYFYQQKGTTIGYIFLDIFRTYPPGKFYIDNIVVRDLSSSDEKAVKEAASSLTINGGSTDVFGDLILENTGINRTIISYKSSDTDVISNDGKVTRPTDQDCNVTLNAIVRRGNYMENKAYNLTVKKADGYRTPLVVKSINGSNKRFSSVSVTNTTGYSEDVHLMVVAYDKGNIVASRCIPLNALSANGTITFDKAIDLSETEYYSIEAYFVDGTETVSNKKTVRY